MVAPTPIFTSSMKAQITSQLLACSTILIGAFWRYTDEQIRCEMAGSSWSTVRTGKTLDEMRAKFFEDLHLTLVEHGYKGAKNGYEEYKEDGRYNSTDDYLDTLLLWRAPDFSYALVSLTELGPDQDNYDFDSYKHVASWLKELGFKKSGKAVKNFKNGTFCYLLTADVNKMLTKLDEIRGSDHWANEYKDSQKKHYDDGSYDDGCDCEFCRAARDDND